VAMPIPAARRAFKNNKQIAKLRGRYAASFYFVDLDERPLLCWHSIFDNLKLQQTILCAVKTFVFYIKIN
jgi:hypothetical protein